MSEDNIGARNPAGAITRPFFQAVGCLLPCTEKAQKDVSHRVRSGSASASKHRSPHRLHNHSKYQGLATHTELTKCSEAPFVKWRCGTEGQAGQIWLKSTLPNESVCDFSRCYGLGQTFHLTIEKIQRAAESVVPLG